MMLHSLATPIKADYQLDTSTRQIYFLEQGQGPPLLLLHGNGAHAALYQPLIEALSPDFRVLAPDLPGYGRSGVPPRFELDLYLAGLERFIAAHIDQPFYLIGHSLGGLIAYLLLLRQQTPPVLKAVWMEAALFDIDWRIRSILPAYGWMIRNRPHHRPSIEHTVRTLSWDYEQANELFKEHFMVSYLHSDRRVQGMFFSQYPSLLPLQFEKIQTPVLCLRGEKETFVSRETPKFAARLPQGQLAVVPGAAHFLIAENDLGLQTAIRNYLLPETQLKGPAAKG